MAERVLVTGASGFIGANFIHHALSNGAEIGAVLRATSDTARLASILPRCTVLRADVRNTAQLTDAITGFQPTAIVHCASTLWAKPNQRLEDHFQTNLTPLLCMLELCRERQFKLIYTGSSSVFGHGSQLSESSPVKPNSVYAISKLAGSHLIELYGSQGTACAELRIFAPYGPMDSADRLIQFVIGAALEGRAIDLTSGRQKRDWVFVEDVCEALWLAVTRKVPEGAIVNIGGGRSVSVKDTVALLLDVLGVDPALARFGARPDRVDEMYDNEADIRRAAEVLGWAPQTRLREGLKGTVEYVRGEAA